MRILKVTQSYAPFYEFGGPPAKVRALAEGLTARGHEVTVLTADWGLRERLKTMSNEDSPEQSPFGQRRRVKGVTAIYLPNWLHYRSTSWNPALGRYLRARLQEFEVVHLFGLYDFFGPRVAEECRRAKIPYVVEPIGMFRPIVRNIWLKRMYHRIWGRGIFTGASAIIATGEQERDELLAGGVEAGKIALRRNGVEVPEKLPEWGAFRQALKIRGEPKLLLFLGRLSQKKSPDLLLRAFARLRQAAAGERQRPHLAFVGPDESGMRRKLEELAKQLKVGEWVHFCPPLAGEQKWSAYRDADIFVLPSQNENFGNAAAEAVAAGTPVVVTDQCGIASYLKDVAGVVVKHEEGQVRQALERLLDDDELYKRLERGCREAVAKLGWGEPVHDMELIYSRLAARSRS